MTGTIETRETLGFAGLGNMWTTNTRPSFSYELFLAAQNPRFDFSVNFHCEPGGGFALTGDFGAA